MNAPRWLKSGKEVIVVQPTPQQIEDSTSFANGVLAAAGHIIHRPKPERDARMALLGAITSNEAVQGVIRRAASTKRGPR
jgi:hypothetical protein